MKDIIDYLRRIGCSHQASKLQALSTEHEEQRAVIASLNHQNRALRAESDKLDTQLGARINELNTDNKALITENRALKAKHEVLNNRLLARPMQLQESDRRFDVGRIDALEAKLEELRTKYNGHRHSTGSDWCSGPTCRDQVPKG